MAMMEISRQINAPAERVFSVFSDIQNSEQHLSGVTKIEMLSDGPPAVGTRWRETRVMFGRDCTEELWISDFEPNGSFTVMSHSCGAEYKSRFDFAPKGDTTDVTFTVECRPLGFIAKVMMTLMKPFTGKLMKSMEDAVAQDIDDLQAVAEAA